MKRWFNVTAVWSVMGSYDIQAENAAEARRIAEERPLPTNGEYLEGSFEVDSVEETDEWGHPLSSLNDAAVAGRHSVCFVCGLPKDPTTDTMCPRCRDEQGVTP